MADEGKDRHSRKEHSSVNAPAKKGGAGGQFTWGAAGDVRDFEPVGTGATAPKVTTAPAAASDSDAGAPRMPSAGTLGVDVASESQFPALPGAAGGAAHTAKHPAVGNGAWKPKEPEAVPRGPLAWLRAYDLAIRRDPVRTKLLTAACVNALSEVLAQRYLSVEGGIVGLLRQSLIGAGLTGLVHKWYEGVERAFANCPRESTETVIKKTVLQMVVLEPILAAIYISAKRLLSGQCDIVSHLKASLITLTLSAWTVWGPTALVQYRFVPADYRTLVANAVSLFHTLFVIKTTGTSRSKALGAS